MPMGRADQPRGKFDGAVELDVDSGGSASLETALRRLVAVATVRSHEVARAVGLTSAQVQVLNVLRVAGQAGPSELAARVGLSPAMISSVVERLEGEGLVTREHDPVDRRRVIVRPCAARTDPIGALFDDHEATLRTLASELPSEELGTITGFLSRLADRLTTG